MRTSVLSFVFVTAVCAAPAIAASADADRLVLSISSQQASRAAIVVAGGSGRYDRIEQSDIKAALALSAQPSSNDDGYKIIASRLHLKADGAGSAGADTLRGAPFAASQTASDSFSLSLAANGPIAQNAIALCNAVPASERNGKSIQRTMALAIVWRVTTGRFSFKWTNYDRVAPSDEIQRNPDFYADQFTQDAETQIDADVTCQPLAGVAIAAKQAAANPVQRVALTPQPVTEKAKPAQTVSLTDAGKPRCDGGMVRQISSTAENYLCLCPGNTTRVETGANAFTCERRTRR